jgi:hypothetical protein
MRKTLSERFWEKVVKTDDCWLWIGAQVVRPTCSYGIITIEGRPEHAHRVAWTLVYGPIPEGLNVLHRCDNELCCRPDHLFLGTQLANMLDMVAKGRHWAQRKTHCKWGHEFTPSNIRPNKSGIRRCQTCHRIESRAYKAKIRREKVNYA